MSKREIKKPQKSFNKGNKRVVQKSTITTTTKPAFELSVIERFINKNGFILTFAIIFAILIFVFKDFVFLKYVFYFKDIGSDTINVDYPWTMMHQNMKAEQGFFTWSFYCGLGYPVFSGILTLINPFLISNLLTEPLFHFLYGNDPAFLKFPYFLFLLLSTGATAFFYFRTIGVSKIAQIIGSLLVTFMGFSIACSSWNTYYDVFNGIFLLFAFEQLYKKNRWYFFPLAIVFLTGNIFNVYMYGFFLITYLLFRWFSENNFEIRKLTFLSLKMAGLTLLGLALNAVNYAVNLINAMDSPRASGDVSLLDEAAGNPLLSDLGYQLKTAFLRLFSSDIIGTADTFKGWYNYLEAPLFYCGLICVVLVFQLFGLLSKSEKVTYGTFMGFWLLVVLFPGLRHAIHLYLGEYYKVGINFFIPILLIFFAMQALSRIEKMDKINPAVMLVSLILLIALLFYPYKIGNIDLVDKKIRNLVVIFLVIYSALLYYYRTAKYREYIKIALLLVVVIELSYFSMHSISSRKAYSAREFKQSAGGYKDVTLKALAFLKEKDKSFYRFEKDYFSGNAMHASLNDAQAQGYFGTTLYSSYNQPYYIKFLKSVNIIQQGVETQTRWAPGFRSRPLIQTMASVKYNVSKSNKPFMLNAGYKTIHKLDSLSLMQNDYFIPFGFCYNHYMQEKEFNKLSNLQKDIALLRCIIVAEDVDNLDFISNNLTQLTASDTIMNFDFSYYKKFVDQRKEDTLQIKSFEHDKITGSVDLDSAKIMFFSIPYDKNWKAKVDGKSVRPELVNIGFLGLALDKGKHNIELYYMPDYFYITLGLTILATLVYLVLFFVSKEFTMKTKLISLGVFLLAYAINYFIL